MTARRLCIVAGLVLAFLLLSALVHTHVTDRVDVWAFRHFFPGRRWGLTQRVADVGVNLLQPAVTGVVYGVLAVRRCSRELLWVALARIAVVTVSVLFLKWFFHRPDVHGSVAHLGGSYPSGHMLAMVAYGAPWWLAVLLGLALLVTGTHWLTDVIGGVLVGLAIRMVVARRADRQRTARRATGYDAAAGRLD
jgi:membrane-associated phospholipid phosphatase